MAQRLNFLLITLCFLVFSFFILFSFSCKKKSSSPISYTNKTQVFEKIKIDVQPLWQADHLTFNIKLETYEDTIPFLFEQSLRSFISLCELWGVQPVFMTQFNRIENKSPAFVNGYGMFPNQHTVDEFIDIYNLNNTPTYVLINN